MDAGYGSQLSTASSSWGLDRLELPNLAIVAGVLELVVNW